MLSTSLARLKNRRDDEGGFTLIELLVVVVILGILIGIAIPVYLNYRKSANDKAAQSDIRGAVSALEVCNSDGAYPSAVSGSGGDNGANATVTGCAQTIPLSSGTKVRYAYTAASSSYIIVARNTNGSGTDASGRVYCYNSLTGGSVRSLADSAYATATC